MIILPVDLAPGPQISLVISRVIKQGSRVGGNFHLDQNPAYNTDINLIFIRLQISAIFYVIRYCEKQNNMDLSRSQLELKTDLVRYDAKPNFELFGTLLAGFVGVKSINCWKEDPCP